jgi:GTP-binding protein
MSAGKYNVVEASFVAAGPTLEALPGSVLPEVAFAGRSNVGKSSLLNMLLSRNKLVRTSSSPGCTKTLNVFHAKLASGLELQVTDLPGYGYAKLSRSESRSFQAMVEGYLTRRPSLVALVILVDIRRGVEDEERQLLSYMDMPGVERARKPQVIFVATKLDKLSRSEHKPALGRLEKAAGMKGILGVSAETGAGRDELWQKLERAVVLV